MRPTLTCCQFATDEEIEAEPDLYECEACPYRLERAKLSPNDEEVLHLHAQLSGRAVQDLHLTHLVFELARLRMSPDEAELLIPKLELIHEFANPIGQDSGIGKKPGADE